MVNTDMVSAEEEFVQSDNAPVEAAGDASKGESLGKIKSVVDPRIASKIFGRARGRSLGRIEHHRFQDQGRKAGWRLCGAK